jgi:hypothetical protein
MTETIQAFKHQKLEIDHKKRAIKGELWDAKSLARKQGDSLKWATAQYVGARHQNGMKLLFARINLAVKMFWLQEKLSRAERKVISLKGALEATYKVEGEQFMNECRFLGAKV